MPTAIRIRHINDLLASELAGLRGYSGRKTSRYSGRRHLELWYDLRSPRRPAKEEDLELLLHTECQANRTSKYFACRSTKHGEISYILAMPCFHSKGRSVKTSAAAHA